MLIRVCASEEDSGAILRSCFLGYWLVLGDFNEVTCNAEKRGGSASFSNSGFADWINNNNLIDLGFVGQNITWLNKRGSRDEVWCRLNRALCFMDWRMLFPEGFVKHLPRTHSDHCPILLKLHSSHTPCSLLKPFRFEAMWMCHAEFDRIIFGEWNVSEGNVLDKILSLSNKLKLWNKESFGCIFQRKRRLLARLQGIQKHLSIDHKQGLVSLEARLIAEYNCIIDMEEIFWLQKFRNNWLKE
ncbi:hypothetical protein ACOSQ2_031172 [Xanthoceras sorbifolium]